MAKRNRRKRKSRTELYRVRVAKLNPVYPFMLRIPTVQRGGNPFGLSQYTLMISAGPGRG